MSWQFRVAIFTFCMLITSASYTSIVPFLPLYLLELGADENNIEWWSAITFAVCFLVGGIMAPIWGRLADLHGQKAMATRAALMLFIAYSSGGLVQTPMQLFMMRILQGFSNGYLPAVLTIVSSTAPVSRLGTSISLVQSAMLVGTVSGPLIGGLLAHVFGYRSSFFVAGAALFVVFLITYFMPKDKPRQDGAIQSSVPKDQSLVQDFRFALGNREIRDLLGLFFVYSAIIIGIQPIMSLFIKDLSLDAEDLALIAGIVISVPSITGSIAAPLWGMFGQNRGYYLAMSITAFGAAIFLAAQGLSQSVDQLLVLGALQGLFVVGIMPSINSQLSLSTPQNFRARAFGIITMAGQFGSMVGPMVSGWVAYHFSIPTQFYLSGIVLMLMSVYVIKHHINDRKKRYSNAGGK